MSELNFLFRLNYYKYFKPNEVNHYNIINKLLFYKQIGLKYLDKYPTARNFINLNEELFNKEPEAKSEYLKVSETQKKIKKNVISDIKTICETNKNYNMASKEFQEFYIKYDYHIDEVDLLIKDLKKDIVDNKIE